MTPTWIGMLVLLVGAALLMRGGVLAMLGLVLGSLLLGGSSAIDLPGLGGSSIGPAFLALGFLALRILLSPGALANTALAARQNWAMVLFCLFGAVTAIFLPRIFEGTMQVIPMRPRVSGTIFSTDPLAFSSQNITSAIYLVGSLAACLAGAVVARAKGASNAIPNGLVWLTWGHVLLGLVALLLTATGQDAVIDAVRNGSYAQLSQEYGGFIRISGFFPEPSSFSSFGFILMVFCLEAWLRDVQPGRTGPAALAMGLMLFMSTSSSAYLSLAVYVIVLILRWLLVPGAITSRKAMRITAFAFVTGLIALILAVVVPAMLDAVIDMIRYMTVDKAGTQSGVERRIWAEQGIEAFKTSYGLGVGAGSFRSSSQLTSIMGSMGVVGLVSYFIYLWMVLQPFRLSTYGPLKDPTATAINLGGACAMAAILSLVTEFVTAPGPIPGLLFSLLAGMAVTLRSPATQPAATLQRPASAPQQHPAEARAPGPGALHREARWSRLGYWGAGRAPWCGQGLTGPSTLWQSDRAGQWRAGNVGSHPPGTATSYSELGSCFRTRLPLSANEHVVLRAELVSQ